MVNKPFNLKKKTQTKHADYSKESETITSILICVI